MQAHALAAGWVRLCNFHFQALRESKERVVRLQPASGRSYPGRRPVRSVQSCKDLLPKRKFSAAVRDRVKNLVESRKARLLNRRGAWLWLGRAPLNPGTIFSITSSSRAPASWRSGCCNRSESSRRSSAACPWRHPHTGLWAPARDISPKLPAFREEHSPSHPIRW